MSDKCVLSRTAVGEDCGRIWLWRLTAFWLCGGLLVILPQHGGSGTELPQNLLAGAVMALMALICLLRAPRGPVTMPVGTSMLLCGLLLWSLPLLWSPSYDAMMNALPRVAGLSGLVGLYVLLLRAIPGMQVRRYWLVIIVVASILQAGLMLKQLGQAELRPYGSFMQPNVLASFLATGLLCALHLYRTTWDARLRLMSAGVLFALSAMLVLQQSRAGLLGALLGAVVWRVPAGYLPDNWSWRDSHDRGRRAWLLMIIGVVTGLILLYGSHVVFPHGGLFIIDKDGSTSSRLYMLRLTMQLIADHPLVGNGYGLFEALFGQLAQQAPPGLEAATVTHPHNEVLYTILEGGGVALTGLLLMVLAVLRRLWAKGGAGLAGLALLLPVAVHTNLEYPLYQSASHGLVLVLLLVVCGPDAQIVPEGGGASESLWGRAGAVMAWSLSAIVTLMVLVFMLTGLASQQRLMQVERAGLMPLAINESAVLDQIPNPYAIASRLEFDREVALLLRYNQVADPALLAEFRARATRWLALHNDPQVYNSLLMIARAQHRPEAGEICLQAHGRWPSDPRFVCPEGS